MQGMMKIKSLSAQIRNNLLAVSYTKNPSFPTKRMLLEITNACNHDCIFCGHHKMTRKIGMMSLDFAKRILQEAYDLGMREVGFYTVGEAFLCKNLALFVQAAKQIGYTYTYITSNGALATADKVIPVIEAGIDSFKFSINAGSPERYRFIHGKDDFEIVKENLSFLYNYRTEKGLTYKLYVSSVLTKYTEQEKPLINQQFLTLCDEIYFAQVMNASVLTPENCTLLKCSDSENKRDTLCPLPFNSVNISWEGYLTACCQDFDNAVAVADLNSVSLQEAWNCDTFCQLREDILTHRNTDHLCARCINRSVGDVQCINSALGNNILVDTILDDMHVRDRIAQFAKKQHSI